MKIFTNIKNNEHEKRRNNLDEKTHINQLTLEQFVDAEIEVCNYYGITVCDAFRESCMNPSVPEQWAAYFGGYITGTENSKDYTHPNTEGQKRLGECITAKVIGIRA